MQNGLVMGIWFLCFLLVALNIEIVMLLPQYASFGSQTFTPPVCFSFRCLPDASS